MNNKEKIISKIGKLVEKANLTEEDLAFFFANDDEETKGTGDKGEQLKVETQKEEKPEGVESAPVEPSEAKPEEKPTEEVKEDVEKPEAGQAVPEAKAGEGKEKSYQAITDRLEALSKALESLSAENQSLKQALKEANVLEVKGKEMPVGVDGSSAPDTAKEYEGLQSAVAMLNKGRG